MRRYIAIAVRVSSPDSVTCFAFGAIIRNVIVRSAWTSGETTAIGGGCATTIPTDQTTAIAQTCMFITASYSPSYQS
jgi:hypothetical protein